MLLNKLNLRFVIPLEQIFNHAYRTFVQKGRTLGPRRVHVHNFISTHFVSNRKHPNIWFPSSFSILFCRLFNDHNQVEQQLYNWTIIEPHRMLHEIDFIGFMFSLKIRSTANLISPKQNLSQFNLCCLIYKRILHHGSCLITEFLPIIHWTKAWKGFLLCYLRWIL